MQKKVIENVRKFLKNIGGLEKLKNHSFLNEWNGTCDCDSLSEVKQIYALLWGNPNDYKHYLPDFNLKEIGICTGKYGGETINSFNTFFGNPRKNFDEQYKDHCILDNLGIAQCFIEPTGNGLIKMISDFEQKVYSIGNFMLMPKLHPLKKASMNQYRGLSIIGWKDLFDKFLFELMKCLNTPKSQETDKYLLELVYINKFYFEKISTIEKFCEVNYLDVYDYICDSKPIFERGLSPFNVNEPQEYIHFIIKYINTCTTIIEKRADKMIKSLENLYDF